MVIRQHNKEGNYVICYALVYILITHFSSNFLSLDKSRSHKVKPDSFHLRVTQLQTEGDFILQDSEVASPRIQALKDTQRESAYMGHVQAERERVAKIRKARAAAETIQRAWRQHCRLNKT